MIILSYFLNERKEENDMSKQMEQSKELIKNLSNFLEPIKERRKYYEDNPQEVEKILNEGTEYARSVARENMKNVKKAMKIDY